MNLEEDWKFYKQVGSYYTNIVVAACGYKYKFLRYVNFEYATNPTFTIKFWGSPALQMFADPTCCTHDTAEGITQYFKQHLK